MSPAQSPTHGYRRFNRGVTNAVSRDSVHDRVALEEIDLYAELIIAAQCSEKPLSRADIDLVLGVQPMVRARL